MTGSCPSLPARARGVRDAALRTKEVTRRRDAKEHGSAGGGWFDHERRARLRRSTADRLTKMSCFLVRSGPCKLLRTSPHGVIHAAFSPFFCLLPTEHLASLGHEQLGYDRKLTEPRSTHCEALTTDDRPGQCETLRKCTLEPNELLHRPTTRVLRGGAAAGAKQ